MPEIFNDHRDFKKGELVALNKSHFRKYGNPGERGISDIRALGIVTGHTESGWIKITWSNGVVGDFPYYKIVKALEK